MANTSSWNIYYPTVTDPVLIASRDLPTMASTTDLALTRIKGQVNTVRGQMSERIAGLNEEVDSIRSLAGGPFSGDRLGDWRLHLMNAPWKRASMVMIGDSITEGVGTATPIDQNRQSALLAEGLSYGQERGFTIPAIGSVAVETAATFAEANGTAIAESSMERVPGIGPAGVALNLQNGRSVTYQPVYCTRIKVHYSTGAAASARRVRVTVDGANVPNPANAAEPLGFYTDPKAGEPTGGDSLAVWDSGPLSPELHVLTLKEWDNTSGDARIEMIEFINNDEAVGVRVLNWASFGKTAKDFAEQTRPWNRLAKIKPALFTIALGTGDYLQFAASEFEGHYRALLNKVTSTVPGAQIMLVIPWKPHLAGTSNTGKGPWDEYREVITRLAAESGYAVLDLKAEGDAGNPWPEPGTARWGELFGANDNINPNRAGHEAIAAAYFEKVRVGGQAAAPGNLPARHFHTLNQLVDSTELGRGLASAGTAADARGLIDAARAAHTHKWEDITDPPAKFPPEAHRHGWDEIDGKPATYPASTHTHSQYVEQTDPRLTDARKPTAHKHDVADLNPGALKMTEYGFSQGGPRMYSDGSGMGIEGGDVHFNSVTHTRNVAVFYKSNRFRGAGETNTFEGNVQIDGTLNVKGVSQVLTGQGFPEGVVTAPPGTLYSDTANTNGAMLWRKASGTGSTGWVVLEGDTGWRDISGELLNGWTSRSGAIGTAVKRINNFVYLRVRDLGAPSGEYVSQFWTAPTGFSTRSADGSLASFGTNTVARISTFSNGAVHAYGVSGKGAAMSVSWSVDSIWPTILPGTATT